MRGGSSARTTLRRDASSPRPSRTLRWDLWAGAFSMGIKLQPTQLQGRQSASLFLDAASKTGSGSTPLSIISSQPHRKSMLLTCAELKNLKISSGGAG